ncbi:hypothetical protein MGYG_02241 [Nannizzia gypsea CBS 118893]|uniref:Uncharacterized protein n=1 Tax=Arthroderma gypseum (strain ATCC MYA-4604 / CBS 118893) TaxID=535722 RepID=E4UQJ8_ARTGP|nr:hypothetical protein MGYG_02241 [Nannizzia gypsea CBS 118893]EFQ99227.1 hypothetical protein MGYG_02241 [Nannizzia gypsea CBS 118893]
MPCRYARSASPAWPPAVSISREAVHDLEIPGRDNNLRHFNGFGGGKASIGLNSGEYCAVTQQGRTMSSPLASSPVTLVWSGAAAAVTALRRTDSQSDNGSLPEGGAWRPTDGSAGAQYTNQIALHSLIGYRDPAARNRCSFAMGTVRYLSRVFDGALWTQGWRLICASAK